MEKNPYQIKKRVNVVLWSTIAFVVVIIAVIGHLIIKTQEEGNTKSLVISDPTANVKVASDTKDNINKRESSGTNSPSIAMQVEKTNAVLTNQEITKEVGSASADSNTNSNQNTNSSATGGLENINTINSAEETKYVPPEIDTSDWLTYTNSEYRYAAKYPPDWEVKGYSTQELQEILQKENLVHYTYFCKVFSKVGQPYEEYCLMVRLKNKQEQYLEWGTYEVYGPGYVQEGESITIDSLEIPTWDYIYEDDKIARHFYHEYVLPDNISDLTSWQDVPEPPHDYVATTTPLEINNFEIMAEITTNDMQIYQVDLLNNDAYYYANKIIESLQLPEEIQGTNTNTNN